MRLTDFASHRAPLERRYNPSSHGYKHAAPLEQGMIPLSLHLAFSHLVAKLNHPVFVCFNLYQVKCDIPVELVEEWDSITNHDWQNRIGNLIRKAETQTLCGHHPPTNKPYALELWP
jgi:hypothetical protein